jgi:hypothetical protein
MPLHLTKVAYGATTLDAVKRKVERWSSGGEMRVPTRMRPKRAEECIGGYLHYIVKHRIIARIRIVRFEERKDGRIDIVCSDVVEVVSPMPRRAHQGWRYLEEAEAPSTEGDGSGIGELPPRLYGKLSALALV